MKKIFKSITAVALVAAMGCTTAFAAPARLKDSDFERSYNYALNYRLMSNFLNNSASGKIYSWEKSKKVTVYVPGGNDMTDVRLYGESSINIKADLGWKVVLVNTNKPNYAYGGAFIEYQSVAAYPDYTVTPYVYEFSTGDWYKTKQKFVAKNGFVDVAVPSGSSKFSWKPYSLVFTNAPNEFTATITKKY